MTWAMPEGDLRGVDLLEDNLKQYSLVNRGHGFVTFPSPLLSPHLLYLCWAHMYIMHTFFCVQMFCQTTTERDWCWSIMGATHWHRLFLDLWYYCRAAEWHQAMHMQCLSYTVFGTETHTSIELVWLIQQQVNVCSGGFRKIISLKMLTEKRRQGTRWKNEDIRQ